MKCPIQFNWAYLLLFDTILICFRIIKQIKIVSNISQFLGSIPSSDILLALLEALSNLSSSPEFEFVPGRWQYNIDYNITTLQLFTIIKH